MVYLNQDGHRSLDSGIAMTVLATVAVILRLWMRYHSKAAVGPDDIFIILGLMGMYAWLGVLIWSKKPEIVRTN